MALVLHYFLEQYTLHQSVCKKIKPQMGGGSLSFPTGSTQKRIHLPGGHFTVEQNVQERTVTSLYAVESSAVLFTTAVLKYVLDVVLICTVLSLVFHHAM